MAENFFYRLGYWVATHPKRTLFISTVLVIACCFGFANFTAESDSENLRIPALYHVPSVCCGPTPRPPALFSKEAFQVSGCAVHTKGEATRLARNN